MTLLPWGAERHHSGLLLSPVLMPHGCGQVHAPLADPVPTPPQWAGVANYKAFRKQRAAQFTSHLPSGEDVTSSGAADAEKHQK